MHAPLCGRFGSHSVNVAHYASLIRAKSPTNCDAHLTESNFQTRSSFIVRDGRLERTLKDSIKLIANNKKAYHDYFIDEKFECGIELFGTEVKSIRSGKCSIKEAFVRIEKGEVYVFGMHVNPYEKGNIFNKDPLRAKKLLMHRSEINKLEGKIREKGLTLVPLQVYFKGSLVKVEIGLARGKKLYDKRADIAKKDQRREVERDYKEKLR